MHAFEGISEWLEQRPASTAAHGDAKTSSSQGSGRGPDHKPEIALTGHRDLSINSPPSDYLLVAIKDGFLDLD